MKPMLAKIGDKSSLSRKGYIFEPKLDGTRAICHVDKKIKFINRRDKNITHRYPELRVKHKIKGKCVLDGEIIVYDEEGNPDFNLLQKREQLSNKLMIDLRSTQYPATYVVFDILEKDGKNLTNKKLTERKRILDKTVDNGERIEKIFSTRNGKALWKQVKKRQLEGLMAKKADSKYYAGKRTAHWLKIKFLKTIDCIIVGYTQEKRIISALALAAYSEGKLTYIGRVGTGFTEEFLKQLHKKLQEIKTSKAPVEYDGSKKIQWVKPKYICEVRYLELSKHNKLRAPAFRRIRYDKPKEECTLP